MERNRDKNCKDNKCDNKNVNFANELRPDKKKCKEEDKCK